jgi:hypothetical protein
LPNFGDPFRIKPETFKRAQNVPSFSFLGPVLNYHFPDYRPLILDAIHP